MCMFCPTTYIRRLRLSIILIINCFIGQSSSIYMSCEISFGLVEDISRLTTHDQLQNFVLRMESYNHSIIASPQIPLHHPDWDYNYSVLGSEKEIIKFYLCSLHPDHYMRVLAEGKLDIRDYVARNAIQGNFDLRLPLYSYYNNEALLHMRCRFMDEARSRNEGLKEINFPQGNRLKNRVATKSEQQRTRHMDMLVKEKYANQDPQTFFKGACQTRNFFSFLDPVFKGQTYNFIEPAKK